MERPSKRAKLLSDASSSAESEDESAEAGRNGFTVNEEYARRFEHNKKREEKDRLEEKYQMPSSKSSRTRAKGKGASEDDEEDDEEEDSEDDESEDDEGELATKDVDQEISATLRAIKNKDPRVYDQNVKFYTEFETDDGGERNEGVQKKEKPMYLHDYHRRNLLAGHTGEEDLEEDAEPEPIPRTYQEEQDAIKRQLVPSMHAATTANKGTASDDADEEEEDPDGENLLTAKKTKTKPNPSRLLLPPKTHQIPRIITDQDIQAADKDPETYLSNFMAARAWLPTNPNSNSNPNSHWHAFESDDSEDEKRADDFEEAYNMRFEDPATANEKLLSFARDVGGKKYIGSVRRSALTGRQRARERERERRERGRREREEERGRLRKLRIEEVEEKVGRIRDAAGLSAGEGEVDVGVWRGVLEGEFDEGVWEGVVGRWFGVGYYGEGEVGEGEGEEDGEGVGKKRRLRKPRWEDDIEIGDLVPGFGKGDGEAAFMLSSDEEDDDDAGVPVASEDPESTTGTGNQPPRTKTKKDRLKEKAEAKRTARRERRQIESLVDATLPISHPTLTPSLTLNTTTKTSSDEPGGGFGFRYRSTSPLSFGLSSRDILFANDSQLNAYAGLKKMASWRDAEKKRRDRKRYSKKARLREWRREVFGSGEVPGVGFERVVGGREEDRERRGVGGKERNRRVGDGEGVVEGERKRRKKRKGKKGEDSMV